MASVPDVLPLSQTGQATWITACPSDLEALVRALTFPVLYLSGMTSDNLINLVMPSIVKLNYWLFVKMLVT